MSFTVVEDFIVLNMGRLFPLTVRAQMQTEVGGLKLTKLPYLARHFEFSRNEKTTLIPFL
jgi:hypothetical protein